MKQWQELDFSNHFMFRVVMEKLSLSKELLERVLDINIEELRSLEPEKSLEAKLTSKGVRLDLYIEDDKGTAYDLEMQAVNVDKEFLGKRARYYQSLMDVDALKKNEPYSKLRKSIVVFICTFDPFEQNLGRYSFESLCREDVKTILGDECYKVFINTHGKRDGLSQELQNLMDYINGEGPKDEFTRDLDDEVRVQRQDNSKAVLYMTYEQTMMECEERGYNKGYAQRQPEIDAANKRAEEASIKAKEADMKAVEASKKNLANLFDFVLEGNITLERGATKAEMSFESFRKALEYYKATGNVLVE